MQLQPGSSGMGVGGFRAPGTQAWVLLTASPSQTAHPTPPQARRCAQPTAVRRAPPAAGSAVTFLPTVARGAQNPVLAVVKVDAAVRGKEGVGQLARGAVEAVVERRLQAVRVVDRVEAWGSTGLRRRLGAGGGGGTAPTYTQVAGLLGGHLSEAEGGHVTPHAEGGGQAPPGLAGAQQVPREREDPGVGAKVRGGGQAAAALPPGPRSHL